MGGNSTGTSPAYSVSPGRSAVALTRPITSPGKASSTVSRSWPNIDCAYFVANGRPVAAWVRTMPRSNRPEHTRTNAIRSRCAGSMLACTLNTSPENGVPTGRGSPLTSSRARRRGGERGHRVQQPADPEVRQRGPEQDRAGHPGQEGLHVDRGAVDLVEQRQFLLRGGVGGAVAGLRRRRVQDRLQGPPGPAGRPLEGHVLAGRPLDQAAEVAGHPDRPVHRRRVQPDPLLDLVEQLERLPAGTVPLVHERHHRHAPAAADVEQLQGLRLQALGRVEQHDRAVHRGQHPVGVLGEVGVARGVEQVEHRVAVIEAKRRRGDRDAPGALHRHPVGGHAAPAGLAVHRACLGDRRRVQGQRLGEGGLPRVGMADDGERAAPARFGEHPGVGRPRRRPRFRDSHFLPGYWVRGAGPDDPERDQCRRG